MASLDDLKADIKRNMGDAIALFDPTGQHVKNTVWPFLEGLVDVFQDELNGVAARIIELEEGEPELLYEETSEQIRDALELGALFAVALTKTIGDKPNEAGKKLLAQVARYSALIKPLLSHIEGITLEDGEEDDDDEGEAEPDANDPPGDAPGEVK